MAHFIDFGLQNISDAPRVPLLSGPHVAKIVSVSTVAKEGKAPQLEIALEIQTPGSEGDQPSSAPPNQIAVTKGFHHSRSCQRPSSPSAPSTG